MTIPVLVPRTVVSETVAALQDAGRASSECVVLWLGTRRTSEIAVAEMYKPDQIAGEDFFTIPRASIATLLEKLGANHWIVAAQVHSHPQAAFHSAADDRWAIVRHVGALSLVLPDFALRTTAATFLKDAVVFALSPKNTWSEIVPRALATHLREVP